MKRLKVGVVGFTRYDIDPESLFADKKIKATRFDNVEDFLLYPIKMDIVVTSDRVDCRLMPEKLRESYWVYITQRERAEDFIEAKKHGLDLMIPYKQSYSLSKAQVNSGLQSIKMDINGLTPIQSQIYDILDKSGGPVLRADIIEILWGNKDKGLSTHISQLKKTLRKNDLDIISKGKRWVSLEPYKGSDI